ncbi:MAG TPA: metallophosphoesterase family protein [Acidimicrobiales bacterium]|nr:metallophosphoesterase family protein [Acidimicrobiales bacterium]
MTTRAVVLADTHLRAGWKRTLPAAVYRLLDHADVVLHAGDLVDASVLETLRSLAPTYAVLGNNDAALAGSLPETVELTFDDVPIAMIHDSGPSKGRAPRLRRRFPEAAVVVFGHSHIPVNAEGIDGQRLFNPGSPTERRSQPHRTAGVLELADGALRRAEIVVVDD